LHWHSHIISALVTPAPVAVFVLVAAAVVVVVVVVGIIVAGGPDQGL